MIHLLDDDETDAICDASTGEKTLSPGDVDCSACLKIMAKIYATYEKYLKQEQEKAARNKAENVTMKTFDISRKELRQILADNHRRMKALTEE